MSAPASAAADAADEEESGPRRTQPFLRDICIARRRGGRAPFAAPALPPAPPAAPAPAPALAPVVSPAAEASADPTRARIEWALVYLELRSEGSPEFHRYLRDLVKNRMKNCEVGEFVYAAAREHFEQADKSVPSLGMLKLSANWECKRAGADQYII